MKPLEGVTGFSREAKKYSQQGKCQEYGVLVSREMNQKFGPLLKPHERNVEGTVFVSYSIGCAFYQFKVPCIDRNPMAKW